jgi:TP901 family phage tail tape measure protein
MEASMAATRKAADPDDKIKVYKDQLAQLSQIREAYNNAAMASGNWHVQTVKNISESEKLTDQIKKQKLGVRDLVKYVKEYQSTGGKSGALSEAIKEQTALRNATASQMSGNVFGKNMTDLHLPKNLGGDLDNVRTKLGLINQAIGSASTSMVNWGKNTQWAGRQITVGLTMPLGMATVGAAALALQVDKSLTDVAKVYDTTSKNAMGKEAELASVRQQGMATATRAAQQYGQSLQDTLDAQAQLAATGIKGAKLQQATSETMRIATLGQMDYQKAVDMTVALQTSFKMSNEDLSKSFNTMNAVENATSLSIDDIATATPRAASALAALGGTANDMIIMLTAMKESGVDASEAANAIKSASATILTPPKKAKDFWMNELNIDIEKMADDAGGNMMKMMTALAKATHGKDAQKVQEGIADLFGKYQFNRESALFTNLGDALNGVANQTKKAMDTVGQSTEQLQSTADQELERWQKSVSGKFKRATESIKAELVPLGMTALQVITPVITLVAKMIDGFNGLSGPVKTVLLVSAGLLALVGPAMMLVGIFANLTGSMIRFGSTIANLKLRFRALNSEEAAAEILAKKAKSRFDTEGAAAANLTLQLQALAKAMEKVALSEGALDMTNDGLMVSSRTPEGKIGSTRQVTTRENGSQMYSAGSVNAAGVPIGGRTITKEDQATWDKVKGTSAVVEDNAKKTRISMNGVGKALGGIAAAGMVFGAMHTGADNTLDTVMNIAMVAGSLSMMFPGVFSKALTYATKLLTTMKGVGAASAIAGAKGKAIGAAATLSTMWKADGIKGVGTALTSLAPRFMQIAGLAARVFGPVGILVGGALIVKKIVKDMQAAEDAQKALATSGSAWADTLGYTYSPGVIAGTPDKDVNKQAQMVSLADKMAKAQDGLADAMQRAAKEGNVYHAAMGQALTALTSGATVAQARQAFEASLVMAGVNKPDLKDLMLKFDSVNLEDPAGVSDAIKAQLDDTFKGLKGDAIVLTKDNVKTEGLFTGLRDDIRHDFGGNLTSDMRAAGRDAGSALGMGIASTMDPTAQAGMFKDLKDHMNATFAGTFNNLASDPQMAAALKKAGISTSDQLNAMLGSIATKLKNDKPLTAAEKVINDQWKSVANHENVEEFKKQYDEMLDTVVQGMVDSGVITEAQAKKMRSSISSINGLKINNIGRGATAAADDITTIATAADTADHALDKLDGRNVEITADMQTNQLKSAMSGTMDAIYAEADRRLQASQDAQLASIQKAGDNRQKALDARGKREDAYWDERSKTLDKAQQAEDDMFGDAWDAREKGEKASWDQSEKNLKNAWDQREKDTQAYYDGEEKRIDDTIDAVEKETTARTDAIQAQIDAEDAADEERQKLFDREKTRIERMAELQSNNVDFNSALNSGNLDEAAKLYGSNNAQVQQWGIDDQDASMGDASAKRKKELEDSIELIGKEKDARIESLNAQKDAIEEAKNFRMDALKAEREAAEESFDAQRAAAEDALGKEREMEQRALKDRQQEAKDLVESQRQAAQDALANARQADSDRTASAQASATAQFQADQRGLAARLQELQAFTPRNKAELDAHIVKVEQAYSDYGLNLETQGNGWSGFIGQALQSNVNTAAVSLQNDINWQAMGQVIADRIAAGTGVSTADLQYFIANGTFPKQQKGGGMLDKIVSAVTGRTVGFHTGGEIGGPGWSAKDRTGVPRSASLYPSEQMALLKKGEFVVNEKATRRHRGLLEQINGGAIARHEGGLADTGPNVLGGSGFMLAQALEGGLTAAVLQGLAEQQIAGTQMEGILGGGSFAGTAQGSSQIDRMFNTIKAAFPKVKLNDGYRPGARDMHGQGKAIDIGLSGVAGGAGNSYMASMNQWIADNIPNVYELIYDGLGDTRPDLKAGQPHNYGAALEAQHRNHVHWAMQSFHKGGGFGLPNLNVGGLTLSDGLANLHKGEAVLTKPLTDQVINNVASGGDTGYNVTIDLRGAMVKEDVDIERAVAKAIDARESRNGRRRVVK